LHVHRCICTAPRHLATTFPSKVPFMQQVCNTVPSTQRFEFHL
jgi:hypothetical protein